MVCSHPLLDGAEGVLDDLPPAIEDVRTGPQALRHPVEHGLVLETRHTTVPGGAPRPEGAAGAGRRIAVVDLGQAAVPPPVARRRGLSRRADVHVRGRVVAEP